MEDSTPQIAPSDLRHPQPGVSDARREHAVSVDRELIPLQKAQKICTTNTLPFPELCHTSNIFDIGSDVTQTLCALFIAGCFLLPWFWFTNVWLFWPYVTRQRRNAVIEKCATWDLSCPMQRCHLTNAVLHDIDLWCLQTHSIRPLDLQR